MSQIKTHVLARKVAQKRGTRGVREVAREIGTSHATLSRIERGYLPDLETFRKVCTWLEIDPGEILGTKPTSKTMPAVGVHFRKDQTLKLTTAQAFGQMVLAAQRALIAMEQQEGSATPDV